MHDNQQQTYMHILSSTYTMYIDDLHIMYGTFKWNVYNKSHCGNTIL